MAFQPFISIAGEPHYWLTNARIPQVFLDPAISQLVPLADLAAPPFQEALVAVDVEIRDGRVGAIAPVGTAPSTAVPRYDLRQGLLWPCFVDAHTHLDKGHTWSRMPNPDGSFDQAMQAIDRDRVHYWTAEDLYRRMEFGLKCSYAHGTQAIRTHLDAMDGQGPISFEVFRALRDVWCDRILLQAVSLVPIDFSQTPKGSRLADLVAKSGGIWGAVVFPNPQIDEQLDWMFKLAMERGLDLDFHVDESLNPADQALRHVAQAKLRHQFPGRVVCSHCCSLSVQSPEVVQETLRWVKEAEISIISLPMCNLFLQDRAPHVTPRYRGVTLLHELRLQGIPVALAGDNCRDAFYAYGDHDCLEVFTQAVRIGHLDRPIADWPHTVTQTPADLMGLGNIGRITSGQAANLVGFKARTFNELLSRPQSDRLVLRWGKSIDTTPPDYADIDT